MFQQNLTTNLLGIANVFVDKIENNSSNIEIHLSTQSKAQVCPCCGQTTKYIHDYRTQKIRDICPNFCLIQTFSSLKLLSSVFLLKLCIRSPNSYCKLLKSNI